MTSCRGCVGELLLGTMFLVAMGAFFTWAMAMPDLVGLPVLLAAMVITALGLVVVVRKVHQSEKGVVKAGDVAERHGGDPLPGVTKAAKAGCGSGLAMLAVLGVCGLLAGIASVVMGGS